MWRCCCTSLAGVTAWVGLTFGGCAPPESRFQDARGRFDRAPRVELTAVDAGQDVFAGAEVLQVDVVIDAVLRRNPTIAQARAGWRGALARYPQATRLEDPTVSYEFAPLSIASSEVDYGQVVRLSQPLPFPGKRRLRGQVVLAEADAAGHGVAAVRLQIASMAAHLYYDLFAIERAIVINGEYERELAEHRDSLSAHLAAGHAWQEDALKVDIELGEVLQARTELEAQRHIVTAQLNELLHRTPERALPPTPEVLPVPPPIDGTAKDLQATALRARPELHAVVAQRNRDSARATLARRNFYPDFRVFASYNSMWPRLEHGLMMGLAMTLPVSRGSLRAAVEEADARRERTAAEQSLIEDRIRGEVERARRGYVASHAVMTRYRDSILPSARNRVEAVRAGLDSGRTQFIEVLRADHDLLVVSLRLENAMASVHRRRVDLDAALGVLGHSDAKRSSP